MCFLVIDGKRFNANHITSVEAKQFDWSGKEFYKMFIVAQPEGYECDTSFKSKKECEDAIDKCLGDLVSNYTKEAEEKARLDALAESISKKRKEDEAAEKARRDVDFDEIELDEDGEWDFSDIF